MVSSNLRAGMTIDKSLILSARKEFEPLDEEIMKLGKDIVTGKELTKALNELGERINSDKIKKTISLINSGIRSGGNISLLLKQTATSMRERNFIDKKTASNVLMYVIFIFFAVAVGAPVLFSLSNMMVEILSNMFSDMPEISTTTTNMPFSISSIDVSMSFILWFSAIFIICIDIMASFILGLISKGKEQEGFKYMGPLLIISLSIFFLLKVVLSGFFKGMF
jgi:archaeal flagellar protein FlaJ